MLSSAGANQLQFQSGEKQSKLIELYTSEGCSSCPPAEACLSKLKSDPGLWKDFVPLAFHVDYWDGLGWRDRFASRGFTGRQRDYARFFRNDAVYTPEFIVSGREWRDWFDDHRLPNVGTENAGILSAITIDNKTFSIAFRGPPNNSPPWDAHVALLGCGIFSKITTGENNGRKLQHDFVVLDHRTAAMKNDSATARAEIGVDSSGYESARKAIAIWISRRNQLEPVQATGGWLTP